MSILRACRPQKRADSSGGRLLLGLAVSAVVVTVAAIYLVSNRSYVAIPAIMALILIPQGAALLGVLPPRMDIAVRWFTSRISLIVWLALVAATMWGAVEGAVKEDSATFGMLLLFSGLVMRFSTPHMEPTDDFVSLKSIHWRMRRAIFVHSLFIVTFALGCLALLQWQMRAEHKEVPFAVTFGVFTGAAAMVFKAQARSRKTCTSIRRAVRKVGRLLSKAPQGGEWELAQSNEIVTAIDELEEALATGLQTGFQWWAMSIVPERTRTWLVGRLHQRARCAEVEPSGFADELEVMQALEKVCSRWVDTSA